MLKACPNQKIPSSIMNINGRTAAASAISAPRVSAASLRAPLRIIGRKKLSMLDHDSEFPENPIEDHRERQRHTIGNFQRIRIIERNPRFREPESHQRNQDVADTAQCLTDTPFVNH